MAPKPRAAAAAATTTALWVWIMAMTLFCFTLSGVSSEDAFVPSTATTATAATAAAFWGASRERQRGGDGMLASPLFAASVPEEAAPRPKRRPAVLQHPPAGDRANGMYANQFLVNPMDHEKIAFDEYLEPDSHDLVMYLPNLAETKECEYAKEILEQCRLEKRNFVVADWYGRGQSSGPILNATLSRWMEDVIALLDAVQTHIVAQRKCVLVGNAVGLWVAVLVALVRPDLVRAIVGVGGDPDFTEDLLWRYLPEDEKEAIMRDGYREIKWGKNQEVYPITANLIEDGRRLLVLRGGPNSLPIDCPLRLVHNLEDDEVPPETSVRLAVCVRSRDVVLNLPKYGNVGMLDAIDDCFAATDAAE